MVAGNKAFPCLCGSDVHVPCGRSCSFMSHCAVTGARHMERVLCPTIPLPTRAHPVRDSPAPPGLLLGARASQGSCGANLLHGISGMAWLSSAQRGRSGAGRACFVSCAAASVCFVDCSKLWGLFLFLRGFMVTWWCGWVRRRFLLVALLYNHCISIWCHRWRLLSGSGNNTS